jgi:putative MATE family efflux protein
VRLIFPLRRDSEILQRSDVVLAPTLKGRTESFLEKHLSGQSIDYRRVIAIFLPVLVDQAFVTCMGLVNTAMISSSGLAAVSAVNMVDSLNIFLVNVFIAVSTGGTVVVAQFKGSGNDKQVAKASAGSLSSVFLLALAISLFVAVGHGPLLSMLFGKASPDVFNNAKIYLIGSSSSYCGIAIMEAVCGALRGVGETRSSFALSFIMNILYVLLNFLFINVLHMGVLGMAISINIARYFAAGCAIYYLSRWDNPVHFKLKDAFHFNPAILRKIFYIGLPFAAEQLFFNGGKILTQTFIVSLGTFAMATNAISISISMLIQIPSNSLSITTITVVGQCIGSRNTADARKFVRSFLLLASAASIVMGLIILPLFHPLVSLFGSPSEINPIAPNIFLILVINLAAQVTLWPISFITPSALRAAGDSRFTSVVSMLSMWLFRVVLGYVLGIVLKLGILGVWLAMDLEWGVRGAIFFSRYRGEKWYKHNLID